MENWCLMLVRILKKSLDYFVKQRVWLLVLWFQNQGIRLQCYFNLILCSTAFLVLKCTNLSLCAAGVQGRHSLSVTGFRGILWWQCVWLAGRWLQIILNFRFFCCLTSCCIQDCIWFVGRCMTVIFFSVFSANDASLRLQGVRPKDLCFRLKFFVSK